MNIQKLRDQSLGIARHRRRKKGTKAVRHVLLPRHKHPPQIGCHGKNILGVLTEILNSAYAGGNSRWFGFFEKFFWKGFESEPSTLLPGEH